MEAEHQRRVSEIVSRVRYFHDRQQQFKIYHGTTSTTRRTKLERDKIIDTSKMTNLVHVDSAKQSVFVEPNVSMAKLVDQAALYGLLPLVVMEFPAITVGGGFAGTAGESSSFRYGLFDKTVLSIEMVLADGELVTASEHERADLFNAAAGTFGTFGVITLLEVKCRRFQPFVRLDFTLIKGMDDAVRSIEELTEDTAIDFLEGIMFGVNQGLIISGQLQDERSPALPCVRYTRAHDAWFYLRAEKHMKSSSHTTSEYVPIRDYLFRYDRGCFWGGKWAFKYFLMPLNFVTRLALDGFMRTDVMYQALHKSRMADQFIVQDIGFPYDTVGSFVEYLDRDFGFYPLWLCPLKMDPNLFLRPRNMPAFSKEARGTGMMINVGLWGPGPTQYDAWLQANRRIEAKTTEFGGLKCFYAQGFYSPSEFWAIYDKESYDRLRVKYKASGLRSICEKVNVDFSQRVPAKDQGWQQWSIEKLKEQWPVRGVYGALHALLSKEYLLV